MGGACASEYVQSLGKRKKERKNNNPCTPHTPICSPFPLNPTSPTLPALLHAHRFPYPPSSHLPLSSSPPLSFLLPQVLHGYKTQLHYQAGSGPSVEDTCPETLSELLEVYCIPLPPYSQGMWWWGWWWWCRCFCCPCCCCCCMVCMVVVTWCVQSPSNIPPPPNTHKHTHNNNNKKRKKTQTHTVADPDLLLEKDSTSWASRPLRDLVPALGILGHMTSSMVPACKEIHKDLEAFPYHV